MTPRDDAVWARNDVDAILSGLFDIRRLLTTLVELMEDEDEGEAEADA